eukprot:GHVN01056384.1.p1 GENE.GHVN01056384.1~~GHVN01056384.1.p1  ORF type:complete len:189 (+),score=3.92 GHVN01056384.1:43-609(+)
MNLQNLRDAVDGLGYDVLGWMHPELRGGKQITIDWFLNRPSDALFVAGAYICLVLIGAMTTVGKRKSAPSEKRILREPIILLQILYDIGQLLLCKYMIQLAYREYKEQSYRPICNRFDPSRPGLATATHIFYLSKVFDFFDTFFIIARGKSRQLSFLHCYHHTTIFLFYWINSNVGYDGDQYLPIIAK